MGRSFTFWCAACALELDDGVDYTTCPRCDGPIEWARMPDTATSPNRPSAVPTPQRMSQVMLGALLAVQAIFAALDPHGFTYLRPLLVVVQLAALPIAILALAFVPTVKALLDERTRILHGLEHATIAVLAERGIAVSHAATLPGMFDLALPNDGRSSGRTAAIRDATRSAIARVARGERELVYTDRCGTSYSVGVLVLGLAVSVAGALALGSGIAHGYAFAGTVVALFAARLASRRLGLFAQRALTVSAGHASAIVGDVVQQVSPDGRYIYYAVHVAVEPIASVIGEPI